jgi:perosamine synthetase
VVIISGTPFNVTEYAVPLTAPFVNVRESELVAEVLQSGRLVAGPMLARFEAAISELVDGRHVVATASGTAAAQIAARTAGWGPGDEIVTNPLAFSAGAAIARSTGATIRFVDVDPVSLDLDIAAVEDAITGQTRGIIPVDVSGWPSDVAAFERIAEREGFVLVQDARDSFGAIRDGHVVGSGHAGATLFTFGSERAITTGGGGALVTPDAALAERWRELIAPSALDCRMGDVCAAIGVAQLEKLHRISMLRRMVAMEYAHEFGSDDRIRVLGTERSGSDAAWTTVPVLLDAAADRDAIVEHLRSRSIDVRTIAAPDRLDASFGRGRFPNAEAIVARIVVLPCFPSMSPQQQALVIDELRAALDAG